MFQIVPNSESQKIIQTLLKGKISFVGRTESNTLILAKSTKIKHPDFKKFECQFKSNKELQANEVVTFSFVCFGKKYLFKATCLTKENKITIVSPTTELFYLQRRSSERLIIPDNYYAVFKITHINNRIVRLFLKINNISVGGCGLLLRSEEPNLVIGDLIKGTMYYNSRPPFDLEGQIQHKRIIEEENLKLQHLGIMFIPTDSLTILKKMKVIVMDIYRDLFKEK
jgi:hypothetical protein